MAIEKTSFKVSRVGMEFSSRSRESVSSEDDELQRQSSVVESEEDEEFNDCDSGAGSDDFDLLELGEVGEEFCQVGDQTCSVPLELYDLPGLGDVLSMDVWNECLTEEERFNLTKYLPDMEQEAFMRTLKEIFTGSNLHFGSPVTKLFHMLKGGLCEPRVALYRQGLNSFQKRQHYHLLQKHQNSMVTSLYQIRDAWLNCRGYSIEEKLRILNIMKSQKSLMCENMEELESDSSERDESGKGLWGKKLKDWKHGLKMGRHSAYGASSTLDIPSQGRSMPLEQTKFGKQNPKGTLKLVGSKTFSAKEIVGRVPSVHHGVEMKSGSYGSPVAAIPRQNKLAGYDVGAAVRVRDHMRGVDDAGEKMYEVAVQRDHNFSRVGAIDKYGAFKMGKKHEGLRGDGYTSNSFLGFPGSLKNDLHTYSSNRTVNMLSDIKVLTAKPSNVRTSYDYGRKVKYPDNFQQFSVEEQIKYGNSRAQNLPLKGSQNELSDGGIDPSFKYSDWNVKNKKWKIERESSDLQVNGRLSQSEYPAKPSHDMVRAISMQNGGREMDALRGSRRYARSEETESDSSDQVEEDEEDNPLMRSKLAYPRGVLDGSFSKSGPEPKNAKLLKKDKKNKARPDGLSHSLKKMADVGEHPHTPEVENYSLKAKQKGKMHDIGHLQNRVLEDSYFSGSGMLNGDVVQKQIYKLGKNGQLHGEPNERFRAPSQNKAHPTETRQKGDFGSDFSVHQSNNLHGYGVGEEDDSLGTFQLAEGDGVTGRLGKKGKVMEAYGDDRYERFDVPLSSAKKQKVKENVTYDDRDENHCVQSNPQQQVVDTTSSKKRGKRKLEDDSGNFEMETSEPPVAGLGTTDVELEPVLHKKPFTLITPTVHNGFSFSIIHFLSAVRMAMITLLPEDNLEVGKQLDTNDGIQKLKEEQDVKHLGTNGVLFHENLDINKPEKLNAPSLAVEEIVNRVRSNPGDPCILETQEPLKDLVRGVLKIFSSKTAPLGAKGWKPLVFYDKSTKNWSWIGPVSHSSSDQEAVEEVTSPESWGLPHKMLVKLVDSFANWLKSGQETLQQIGSLPAPPSSLMQFNLDEKERFRDLRAQKSLTTISPSSEEVRAYFRKEEVLRYSIPDRAFSYTAIDGRKSIVAPLKRCGGKPTSKARDHFMLKCDRPPHVTILCLVRDAAARLPGSIGTRADVSTLIRDSQFIVEDVSDAQVNQVVSGALDRLHYERDPCVQFDGERKLWVYLHREREEEDFEDDGTSSTKKWKRPKKEAPEQFEQGTVTVAYHRAGEQTGFELSSDLNVEPPNERTDPIRENGSPCQENSTNEDFDDETFG